MLQVLEIARRVAWQPAIDGRVPFGALPVGRSRRGEKLCVARVAFSHALTSGKVPILTCLKHKTNVVRRRNASASLICYVTL